MEESQDEEMAGRMFPAGRMVLRLFLGSHGTLVVVSAPFMMPLRDSDIPMNVPCTFCNKQPLQDDAVDPNHEEREASRSFQETPGSLFVSFPTHVHSPAHVQRRTCLIVFERVFNTNTIQSPTSTTVE